VPEEEEEHAAAERQRGQPAALPRATPRGGGQPLVRVSCTQRTVHSEGGLAVVDDGEFDEEVVYEPVGEVPPGAVDASNDPTPAEALVRQQQQPLQQSQPSGGRAPRAHRRAEASSVSFAVQGGRSSRKQAPARTEKQPPPAPEANPMSVELALDSEMRNERCSEQSTLLLEDVWVPEWATSELHERALDELQAVEAMFPEECSVLTPEVQAHLVDCVSRRAVNTRPEPLRLELLQSIPGAEGGLDVLVEFSFPPYYPTQAALVELREPGDPGSGCQRALLDRLEAQMREGVLRASQGGEVVMAVVEWLAEHGALELAACRREAAAASTGSPPGAEDPPAPGGASGSTTAAKRERIEQARLDRMSSKYSQSWDLCYAFVKHGTCKDKSCQWRHAAPGKEKKEAGGTSAVVAAAAENAAAHGSPMPNTGRSAKRKMPKKD